MSRIVKFFKCYSLPLFSGILMGTSYIPFPPWALAFCYAPLWWWTFRLISTESKTSVSDEKKPGSSSKKLLWQIFWGGWWTQFVLSLIGFHWIAHVAHEFGFMPWSAAIAVLFLFAGLMHLYIPVALWLGAYLAQKLKLHPKSLLLIWPALFTLGEMYWPSIFPWNLGYPLYWGNLPWAQWADTIGFEGLSFLVYALNGALILFWLMRAQNKKKAKLFATTIALTLVVMWWGGTRKQQQWQQSDANLSVLVVQANIGNLEKYYAEKGLGYQQYIIDQYFQLTRLGLAEHPQAQLVVWPESAFPDFLDSFSSTRPYPQQFIHFIHEIKRPILTGAYSADPPSWPKRHEYNGIFLFNENGELMSSPYHKTHLLIFGETLPFVEEFPWLAKYNPGGSGFGRGSGAMTLKLGNISLGPQICYESLYPNFSQLLAQKGAQIIVNVTNDSWFGSDGEPDQHMIMTLARAVETRRPLIRSTNTGVSTVALADGTILEKSPKFQTWTSAFEVKYQTQPETTFFTRYGSWLTAVLSLILGLSLIWGKIGRRGSRA